MKKIIKDGDKTIPKAEFREAVLRHLKENSDEMSSCLKIPNNGHLNPETEERVDYQQKQLEVKKLCLVT